VKSTSLHNAYGFAFHIPQRTGFKAADEKDMASVLRSTTSRFTAMDQPLALADAAREELFRERQDGIGEFLCPNSAAGDASAAPSGGLINHGQVEIRVLPPT